MASNDLIFQDAPLVQPAALVFGGEAVVVDFTVDLAASMPALQVQIGVGTPSTTTLDATLPSLNVSMQVAALTSVALTTALPALKVAVSLKIIAPPVDVTVAATMPALHVAGAVAVIQPLIVAAVMPGLKVTASALYISDAERPVVTDPHSRWSQAVALPHAVTDRSSSAISLPVGVQSQWTKAIQRPVGFTDVFGELHKLHQSDSTSYSIAKPVASDTRDGWRELSRAQRPSLRSGFQTAKQVAASVLDAWQERFRDRRPTLITPWGEARAIGLSTLSGFEQGKPLIVIDRSDWQEAIQPAIGVSGPVVVPPKQPCYTPPKGNEVFLFFQDEPGTSDLVFVCEAHEAPGVTPTIVVPIRRVYFVNNTSSLHRVDTGQQLPAFSMQLSLDVDSWTWGFSAAMPYDALALLGRQVDGSPAELAAVINGVEYRVIFEKYTTTRQCGTMPALAINCRGKQALLDAPYAPVTTFINDTDINANQLMLQALSINGVPLGWDVDFQLEDWIVPANQFALTGSYMGAVTQIAASVGGYIQPSPVDQTLLALSRYPTAPWNWQDAHIDYELPSCVTTVEGIEYREKVVYNHVFVSGTSAGVTGSVKRAGTAGDTEMPMITDPLIGDVTAARQRGRVALSDTGRQEFVNLTLPVLPETGIILPGKMVRYVDNETNQTRVGIVRSMGTAVSQSNLAETWQTIGVETHVD